VSIVLSESVRDEFLALVDREFGIRGSDYGATRLADAIARVLPRTTCQSAEALLEACAGGAQPGWLGQVVEHLTVGETYFMRDPAQIAALRETILPDVITRRAAQRRMRFWSAGCSTGEEPYTLAMLLEELTVLGGWDLLLVGTDVNRESLRIAREARYPAWSFRATPPALRDRHFDAVGSSWQLRDSIRRLVRFAWMNLGAESLMPPSADIDLIMCRNVTIYFDEAATQRLYRALVAALSPGGWLMLGPSDPLPEDRSDLERLEVAGSVLWRRRLPGARPVTPVPQTRSRALDMDLLEAPRVLATTQRAKNLAPAQRAKDLPSVAPRRQTPPVPATETANAELEAGLLALEAGSATTALEWLRQATFRDPRSPLAQFALGQAYLSVGDVPRAQAAFLHTRRLLSALGSATLVPGSDAMPVETLRQAVQTHLLAMEEPAS
jgi:chemotaxis protein methyltransferase CheR